MCFKKVFHLLAVNNYNFQFETLKHLKHRFCTGSGRDLGNTPLETGMICGKFPAMVATGNHVVEAQPVKGWPVTGA